jgi:hypothetical protein
MKISVLFARKDSVYKSLDCDLDVWDIDRDARKWSGGNPLVAHPPCRSWGRLRHMANPRDDEKDLARLAVLLVRQNGGVLEHPARSLLWQDQQLPAPGQHDHWGGWTLPISQKWFGHRAEKLTYLYIVGIDSQEIPSIPLILGDAPFIVGTPGRRRDGSRLKNGDQGYRPEISKAEREKTPQELAIWLVELAQMCVPNPINPLELRALKAHPKYRNKNLTLTNN